MRAATPPTVPRGAGVVTKLKGSVLWPQSPGDIGLKPSVASGVRLMHGTLLMSKSKRQTRLVPAKRTKANKYLVLTPSKHYQ